MVKVYDPVTGTYKEQTAPASVSFGTDDPTMLKKNQTVGTTTTANPIKETTQTNTTTPKFTGLDVAKTTDQASRGFIPTPTQQTTNLTPTKANPVIIQEAKPTQVGGVDYSQVDNMDANSLQRYVDEWQVKATMGEEIPTAERMKLLAASRKLATLTSPTTVSNPYEAEIKTQEQQRAEMEAKLKAQEEALISAEEKRLNALYSERSRQAQEAGQRQATAGQQAMSFSGLGRSTFNADQQARIQQSVEANLAALNEEKFIALERYRAQQAGATAESLAGYDQRINQLKDKQAQFQLQQAEQINKFNQESASTYQEKIDNLMKYAQSWRDPNAQLTDQELATAKAYGQIAIDKDGNINTALLKEIDPRIMSEVIKSAAEARGAIPQEQYDFMNLGSGLVAKTNKVTGEVEWYQGDVKLSPLDQARINEINAGIDKTRSQMPVGSIPSTNATQLISKREGFRDKAYQDSAGVRTVGFGFTNLNGRPVQPGDTIDRATAEQLLQKEIASRQNFMKYITVPLSENQKAALSSFEYNLGSGIWDKNAKPILDKVNQGDLAGAASLMKQYINAGGKPIQGLLNRRNEEAQLLQSNQPSTQGLSGVAQMVQKGTLKLSDVPAEQRMSVANELSNAPRTQSDVNKSQELINRIDRIKSALSNKLLPRGSALLDPDIAADVDYIKNNLMLKTFAEAKESGVTFGAASNAEWEALKNAATSIKWTMSKDALTTELDRLKAAAGGYSTTTTTPTSTGGRRTPKS